MLVQRRGKRLRLIEQHHHALASGQLAARWRGVGDEPEPLPPELVLAVSLHDVAWRKLDERPLLDPDRGVPYDFQSYPQPRKLEAYREGLDRMASVHPHAGLLGSLHYASFLDESRDRGFLQGEGERRRRLGRELARSWGGRPDEGRVERDLGYLKAFDNISLYLCLASPAASEEDVPSWVRAAERVRTPGGATLELDWAGEGTLTVAPYPFRTAFEVRVPVRELGALRFAGPDELSRAWEEAEEFAERFRVVPGR